MCVHVYMCVCSKNVVRAVVRNFDVDNKLLLPHINLAQQNARSPVCMDDCSRNRKNTLYARPARARAFTHCMCVCVCIVCAGWYTHIEYII